MSPAIDELDDKHARAVLDILEADGAIPVYGEDDQDGKGAVVPAGAAPPYYVVYSQVSWPQGAEGQSLDGRQSTCVTRWLVHAAGGSQAAARSAQSRARQLLLNVRPTIAGRSCGLIGQESSLPPVRDEETGKPVFDAVAVYVLTTFDAT